MSKQKTKTIDLGWDKVVLERLSSAEWLMEPVGRKIRIERVDRGRGHRWDAYFRGNGAWGMTGDLTGLPTLREAVERALTAALVQSGKSRRSIAARKAAATKKARREAARESVHNVLRKKLDETADKLEPGEIIRRGRKKAPWNF